MLPASRCAACGDTAVPPRDRCASCGAGAQEHVLVGGHGTVVAATWVPSAFGLEGFGAGGFGVAWIDLDDGPRVQVLVEEGAPGPETVGSVSIVTLGDLELPVFVPGDA